MKTHILVAAALLAATTSIGNAATIFIQFAGSNGQGEIDGTAFFNEDWVLEYGIDDTVPAAGEFDFQGSFENAILEGRIQIGGTLYELGGTSITGRISLEDLSTAGFSNGDGIIVVPTSGGAVQFLTGDDTIFPNVFGDHTNLQSANPGATVANNTADSFNNRSIISFQRQFGSGLFGADGEEISIFEDGGAATGNISFSVSETPAVPEPAHEYMAILAAAAIFLRRIRRPR